MSNSLRLLSSTLFALSTLLLLASPANANEGDPIAIRSWPQGVISIETHWGWKVAISDDNEAAQHVARELTPSVDKIISINPPINHWLSRQPNAEIPSWKPAEEINNTDPNAVHIQTIADGSQKENALLIEVDSVRIVALNSTQTFDSKRFVEAKLTDIDVLILNDKALSQIVNSQPISPLIATLNPKLVLLNATNEVDGDLIDKFKSAIGAEEGILAVDHNTLAISKTTERKSVPQVVTLTDSPWKMPAELTTLFVAMEKSCDRSQTTFKPLSVKQLNFKPDNGTHTPRWNAEHMMGRQLLFFSQIYHAVDPAILVMDLNPKQMPPDYEFAHPDWTGAEEARQMQRVSEFCRRFAYLFDGIGVEQKAPGSRWPTLSALLKQMDRHYDEHTANTIKKFSLPEWPSE